MLNRIVSLSGKARALAEEALVALDAHDDEDVPVTDQPKLEELLNTPNTAAKSQPWAESPPEQHKSQMGVFLLQALVEAITGEISKTEVSPERVEVLISQLNFARDQVETFFSNHDTTFSIVELVDKLIEAKSGANLVLALQGEQAEQTKLRRRLEEEIRLGKETEAKLVLERHQFVEAVGAWAIERGELQARIDELEEEKVQLSRVLANEVNQENMIDARILKSILVSLGSQIDNKAVRNSLLMIAADMLHMSNEEREKASIPLSIEAVVLEQKSTPTLASAFVDFLHDETLDDSLTT